MEPLEEYGTKEQVIERFTEVINNAKPGQIIQFAFRAPKDKKEEVTTSKCRIHTANDVLLAVLQCINEELEKRNITQKGFIAMDQDGEWYFYPEMPRQVGDCWYSDPDQVLLLKSYLEIDVDWKDTLRVVY